MLLIPTPEQSNTRVRVPLSGVSYSILFYWNKRDESWRIDIAQDGQDSFLEGIKLTPNSDLLGDYPLPELLSGRLYVIKSGSGDSLGRDNLGTDKAYRLIYVTNEELIDAEQ